MSEVHRAFSWLVGLTLLASVVLFGRFLQTHDWEWGRQRSLLVLVLGLCAFLARSPAGRLTLRSPPLVVLLWSFALIPILTDVRTGIESIQLAGRTGEIRMDQGQT